MQPELMELMEPMASKDHKVLLDFKVSKALMVQLLLAYRVRQVRQERLARKACRVLLVRLGQVEQVEFKARKDRLA